MEVSDVRRRIRAAIDGARVRAAERRASADDASLAYDQFLEATAVPAFHTVVNALTGEGHRFKVITPGRAVRMSPERTAEDFIELSLDTAGDAPQVICHTSRARGGHVVEAELVVGSGAPDSITDQDLLAFLLKELEPYVER